MKDRIKKLLTVVSDSEKIELGMLNNGFIQATKENQQNSSRESMSRWRSIRTDLSTFIEKLETKYFPDESVPENFKNQTATLKYLTSEGWKIGKSQFNKHCTEKLLRPEADGTYNQQAVDKYAKTWLKQVATGQKLNERLDKMQEEKLEADLRASKFKMEEAEFNLGIRKNKFVPREDFELAIVARAVAYMAHLNHTVQSEAAEWIDIVGGDQARAPELVQAISRAIEQRMGDFAADAEFDVILEAN